MWKDPRKSEHFEPERRQSIGQRQQRRESSTEELHRRDFREEEEEQTSHHLEAKEKGSQGKKWRERIVDKEAFDRESWQKKVLGETERREEQHKEAIEIEKREKERRQQEIRERELRNEELRRQELEERQRNYQQQRKLVSREAHTEGPQYEDGVADGHRTTMPVDYSPTDFRQSLAAIDAASRDGVRISRQGDTTILTEHRDPYSFYWQLDQARRREEEPMRLLTSALL